MGLYFSSLLSSWLGIQFDVNIPTVFFFSWPSPYFKVSRIARFLNKSIFYGNNFFNYVVNHRSIIKLVISYVKCRIKLDFCRLSQSRFMDYWICGNLSTVTNETVNIKLPFIFDYSTRALYAVSTTKGYAQRICADHGLCC